LEYRRFVLVFDDESGGLGELALALVRSGVDSLYTNDADEGSLLVRQEGGCVGGVLVPAASALDRVASVVKRWHLPPAALVPVGDRPDDEAVDSLRAQGLRWALWSPFGDRELRFAARAAISETDDTEIRFDLRVPTELAGRLGDGDDEAPCEICDLSESGAQVVAAGPAAKGARLRLGLDLGEGRLDLDAVVVWSRPCGDAPEGDGRVRMGICFSEPDRDAVAALSAFLGRERALIRL
jgi:hypothetical protein